MFHTVLDPLIELPKSMNLGVLRSVIDLRLYIQLGQFVDRQHCRCDSRTRSSSIEMNAIQDARTLEKTTSLQLE
jgi:hypothetical protein